MARPKKAVGAPKAPKTSRSAKLVLSSGLVSLKIPARGLDRRELELLAEWVQLVAGRLPAVGSPRGPFDLDDDEEDLELGVAPEL